jgi:hypothetical protein
MSRAAVAVAILAALSLFTIGIVAGTWAVGGSDSSCYALMAEAFARGSSQPYLPLAVHAPWSNAALTFAPAGFIPSPVRPAFASPVCAPGFSLLLAPFRWLGGMDGIFVVTPLAAAILVWCTFVVARHLAGPIAGAAAAVLVATSPIVLFQTVQPMNDITTTALWMAVVAGTTVGEPRRPWIVGALTGVAILVRPNLAPLALIVGIWLVARADRPLRAAFQLIAASAPGIIVVAVLNWTLYGHPARLGYGSAADLFSVTHVATNAAHYGRALFETQTPFLALALAAPFVVRREVRGVAWLGIAMVATTVAIYLLYRPFEEWWYVRFLLPAIAVALALATAVAVVMVRKPAVVAALVLALSVFGVWTAKERQAFQLQALEARFRHAGHFVRDRLPPNAVFLNVWQSGTMRYYADRESVLWDSLDPSSLESAIAWLRQQGFEPFLLFERWEESRFRLRFAPVASEREQPAPVEGPSSLIGLLDWPPRYEIDRQVRVYSPADRDAYLRGQPYPTEYVFAR